MKRYRLMSDTHPTVQAILDEMKKGESADYERMKALACEVVAAGEEVPPGASHWINTHKPESIEEIRAILEAEGYPVKGVGQ